MKIVVHCDQDELFGLILEDGLDGVFQLLAFAVESWQDDSDVFGGQSGFLWWRDRLESPESP